MGVTFEVFRSAGTRPFSRLCCGMGNRSMLKSLTIDSVKRPNKAATYATARRGELTKFTALVRRVDKYLVLLRSVCWFLQSLHPEASVA